MSAGLQAEYPEYRTYALQSDETAYTGRMMVSPAGLDVVIICGEQVLFIESVEPATDLHRIYYWKLGSDYLSFELSPHSLTDLPGQALKLAVLADEAYARFHQQDLARAVFSSVNGVNAFLQKDQQISLQLQFFGQVDRMQILTCRTEGFRGRAGESLKLFGDLIAEGRLSLTDFDLGHLLSGRGFGSNTLPAVAGSDTYYDWNEDGVFDGPAKAGGGTGAARPIGANWWGNLCKGVARQLKSSNLALSLQRSAELQADKAEEQVTADLGNLEHFPISMKHYAGPGTMGEDDFPHLSCLPSDNTLSLPTDLQPMSKLLKDTQPEFQTSFTSGALWPMFLTQSEPDSDAFRDWLIFWRFR
ncbi:hypothetical protein CRP01_09820 [Flavilitoribacter nigricans DSM 23189 = NBRC 102662]|uniref:Uncharacterized protein n=1 Tax=Flavilitoribacter nigricans (strain ATCC 23147 / DSM 23189 / NBRC 102662 / NCIMB 1420 / SS-2) TaxID=1122177 RepID=A0A2D0NDY7_FLAN2|nr:hypothetical protein CRP01_09820 [Flavilitoribacter nigricans DSM 23189 = NBRC 102662]